jgi:hypothetical protein
MQPWAPAETRLRRAGWKKAYCLLQGTKVLSLSFHETKFALPRHSIFNLFEDQPELFDETGYEAKSSVTLAIFEIFVKALETDLQM